MVGRVIDSLMRSYDGSLASLETMNDKKVEARKEGIIGNVLSKLMTDNFRRFNDSLMVYTGKKYELLKPEDVVKVVYGFMLNAGCGPAYMARSVNSVCRMVMSNPFLKDFEPKKNIIYMKNCVLVVDRNGDVAKEDFSPRFMSNIYLDFPYVEGMGCPNWERFLSTVLDDVNARRVLQEFLGCMFVDKDTLSIEKSMYLYGPGSNGKSVIYETLEGMLGDNVINAGLDQLNGKNGSDYFTAELVGKLLAYNSDAEAKDISSGKYKQLVSKEKVMVRPIRQSPFESDDWPMFIANINKSIITTDSSDGFWRRNIVIGFTKIFSDNPDEKLGQLKADKSFKNSMRGEYPGIFNWILEGRRRIIAQKGVFTRSRSIEEITADMRNGSTGVYAFLAAKNYTGTKPESGIWELKRVLAKDMYYEYCQWCAENGYRDVKNISRFKEDMDNAKITWKRSMKVNGQVSSGYVFYEVTPIVEVEEDAGEQFQLGEDELEDMPEELFD